MKDLVRALDIFLSKKDVKYPIHCEHDELSICGYEKELFTEEELRELEELSFTWTESDGWSGFVSYKYS